MKPMYYMRDGDRRVKLEDEALGEHSYVRMTNEQLRSGISDEAYTEIWPNLPWYEPMLVCTFSGQQGYGCRLCIAKFGLHGHDVEKLPKTVEAFAAHIRQVHK